MALAHTLTQLGNTFIR